MALQHLEPCQPIDIGPLGEQLDNAQSSALFKSEQLEVMRVVLKAGKSMPSHHVDGEVTVQCLEGRLDVMVTAGARTLLPGQLLYLPAKEEHALHALEDSSALVTVVLV
ncbi:MAG TPA: cupin domain-containing protein [Candidatus Aquabacterium excrementipullorum]|nr:cupin domain-containing protein [Candidatus Aquabacterium excrementipullorum]